MQFGLWQAAVSAILNPAGGRGRIGLLVGVVFGIAQTLHGLSQLP